MQDGVVLIGSREVERAMQLLGDKVGKKVIRSVAGVGGTALKKEVTKAAPRSQVNREEVYGGHRYTYLKKALRQSIKKKRVKAVEAEVKELIHTGDAFWGLFTERGTKPHVIRPKRQGGKLRTPYGALRRVDHPGQKAQRWMSKAVSKAGPKIRERMEKQLLKTIKREANKKLNG